VLLASISLSVTWSIVDNYTDTRCQWLFAVVKSIVCVRSSAFYSFFWTALCTGGYAKLLRLISWIPVGHLCVASSSGQSGHPQHSHDGIHWSYSIISDCFWVLYVSVMLPGRLPQCSKLLFQWSWKLISCSLSRLKTWAWRWTTSKGVFCNRRRWKLKTEWREPLSVLSCCVLRRLLTSKTTANQHLHRSLNYLLSLSVCLSVSLCLSVCLSVCLWDFWIT